MLDSREWQLFSIRHLTDFGFVPPQSATQLVPRALSLSWVGFIEFCSRKERNGTASLLAEVWKLRGVRRKMGTLGCSLCSGKMDVKRILLRLSETRKSGTHFLNKMWPSMKEHVAYTKIFGCTNKALLVGRSRDRFPVVSLGIFSVATDRIMCSGVDSASKNEYQVFLLG